MTDLLFTVANNVGRITFNRPEARNALTFQMYEELARICATVSEDKTVKSLIIAGAGAKAFAAGTDMTEFRSFSRPQDALDYEEKMERVFSAIEKCPMPTIAAITGACTGGGAAIAAACDMRICDRALKFGFPMARTLGNCLSIANLNRLSALVGAGRVKELLFTARLIGADEALGLGLVTDVMENGDAVEARAVQLAEMLAQHAPLTLRTTKEGLRRLRTEGPVAADDDLITAAYMSTDFKEGLEAFLAKRKPNWRGI